MSWFARIEERCAAFIERAFANMFPSDVEPAHVARKLVATMEARSVVNDRVITAPSAYIVCVNPLDFARLEEHRSYLEREWSALLADVAQRVGIRLDGAPSVQLRPQERVAAGAIEIHAERTLDEPALSSRFVLESNGEGIAATAFLVAGAARVGRSPQCDIVLPDPSVSRSHALLDVRDGTLFVQDAGSTNGTFVNGERVESRKLKAGDTVAFGKTSMRVSLAS
ncbi:MAG TPA: FhaA domain-containing protein [Candidatus Baltobacteraceae bacterium]|nr:FhaA domain-containing protein [Candidatus Baltobacteraceae bacterium]